MKNKAVIETVSFIVLISVLLVFAFMNYEKKDDYEQKIVGIHIKGEINAPGYYELKYGSRVKDAILAAGSETENADLSDINLAKKLSDGEELLIPGLADSENIGKSGLININTADMYQLCKLDGIGETTASHIIEYRVKNDEFKTIDELKKVKGIGTSKFNAIKDKIVVQ